MARPEKVQEVQEITTRFNDASAALLTEYRGLTVSEIAELRSALRDAGAEYKVLKNTLARIAVREVGLEELVGMLTGPTAIAFIEGDAVEAAKALDDAAKKFPVLVIKGGVLDGKIVDASQAQALAKLEPREVQLAKIVMMVNTPLQQTVNVFAAMLRDVGSMLAQVLSKKESGELPSGDAPAPAAEAPAAEDSSSGADSAESSGEDGEAAEASASAGGEETENSAAEAGDGAEASVEPPESQEDEAPAVAEAEEQAAAAPEAEDAAQPEATEEEVSEESASKEEQ